MDQDVLSRICDAIEPMGKGSPHAECAGPFTGQKIQRIPKTDKPRHSLAVRGKDPLVREAHTNDPALTLYNRVLACEALGDLPERPRVKRISKLNKVDQFLEYQYRFLGRIVESESLELSFVTIDLAEGEDHADAIDGLFKRLPFAPLYVGVRVPAHKRSGFIRHVHLMVAAPLHASVLRRYATFEIERNKRRRAMNRVSVDIRAVTDARGLVNYLSGVKNLRIPGAKPVASRMVKSRADLVREPAAVA